MIAAVNTVASMMLKIRRFAMVYLADIYTDSVDKKNQLDVTYCIFISLLIVAQHVSGNHVPIIRS